MEIFLVLIFIGILVALFGNRRRSGNPFTDSINSRKRLEKRMEEKYKNREYDWEKGSPQYQAMLKKNNGVAPGGGPSAGPVVKKGPRGGRYTEGRTKNGKPTRRYF